MRAGERDLARRVAAIFAAVFLFMAAVGGVIAWVQGDQARMIAAAGMQAEATVVERRAVERRRERQRDLPVVEHYAAFAFTDDMGRAQRVELAISAQRYEAWPEGTRLRLRYALSDPTVVELAPGELVQGARFARWFALGTGALALLALGLRSRLRA